MEPILLISIFLGFIVTFLIVPFWIKKANRIGLKWIDVNKYKKVKIAGSGGIAVIVGFILGVLFFIAIRTFVFHSSDKIIEIFAIISSILLLAGIGIIDDLLGWQHGGLSKKFRLFLVFLAAIPLMVINAGHSSISLPLLDGLDLGLIYPILFIPIGIIGAATTFNFLAGFNGLEASQGMLILFALSIVAYFTGNSWISLILLIMVACLFGFWIFNKSPAKVFPGDVLTYPVGGLIAIVAIFGNFEKIAIFFFIPYIIEVVLKIRGRLKKESFGKPNKDGSIEMRYKKIYGLEHFAIWFLKKIKKTGKVYEKEVVYFINFIQFLVIIIGFFIFRNSIFIK